MCELRISSFVYTKLFSEMVSRMEFKSEMVLVLASAVKDE